MDFLKLIVFRILILYPLCWSNFPASTTISPFRSVCQGQSAEILKKSGCVQFVADKAVDFVAHGFPAGGAEMERHLIGGVADFLHQGGRRRGGALCRHVSAIVSLTLERGKGKYQPPSSVL